MLLVCILGDVFEVFVFFVDIVQWEFGQVFGVQFGGLWVDMEDGQGIVVFVGYCDVVVFQYCYVFGIVQVEQWDGVQYVVGE